MAVTEITATNESTTPEPTVNEQRAVGAEAPPKTRTKRDLDWLLGLIGLVLLFVLWESASRSGLLSDKFIPSASEVFASFFALMGTGEFWGNVGATMQSTGIGLLLVLVIGPPLALLVGLVPAFRESTWFLFEFLKPIPPIVLIPLALLLWGPVLQMKVVLITFGALWPFLVQLVYGIRETDQTILDMSRSYRLSLLDKTVRVIAPSLLPYALTGLRISASIAVVVSVVTELVGGAQGLGQALAVAQVNNNLPVLYAYVLTAGVLGIAVNLLFLVVERPLLFWHASIRERTAHA